MRHLALLSVVGLALLGPSSVRALPNFIVNDRTGDPAGQTSHGPRVAVLDPAVFVAWGERTLSPSGWIQYAYSLDGGMTFVDGGNPPAPAGWNWFSDPRVEFDPSSAAIHFSAQIIGSGAWGIGFVRGTFVGSTLVWDTPAVVDSLPSFLSLTGDALSMVEDESGGRVVLVYATNAASTPAGVRLRSSTDGGATWSSAVRVDDPPADFAISVESTINDEGDLFVSWTEDQVPLNVRRMRVWRSGDPGFGTAANVVTRAFSTMGPLAPGAGWQGEYGEWPIVSQATDRSGGPYYGRTWIAWNEYVDVANVPFPSLSDPELVSYSETEPNDTAYVLIPPLDPGVVVRGSVATVAPMDADWFVFQFKVGDRIALWPDSMPPIYPYDLRVIGPDGVQRLTGGNMASNSSGAGHKFGFSVPVNGTYYLRFAARSSLGVPAPAGYRIRTTVFGPGPDLARDQSDVVVTWSDDGATWATPVRVNADPQGFHAFKTEIAAGYDGTPYISWFDYSQSTYGGIAHRVVSRSTDGGASWSSPVNLSSVATDWTAVVSNGVNKLGEGEGLYADRYGVRAAWSDGRLGDPDVYTTGFHTGIELASCPNGEVNVQAGDDVAVPFTIKNLNELFGNSVRHRVDTERNWPVVVGHSPVAPSGIANMQATIAVPDSAAAGYMQGCLNVDLDGAEAYVCCFQIRVRNALAVGDRISRGLELRIGENPVRGGVDIAFALPGPGRARLSIFGVNGERVRDLADGDFEPGVRHVSWDGRDGEGRTRAPGIYFARLEWGGQSAVVRFARIE